MFILQYTTYLHTERNKMAERTAHNDGVQKEVHAADTEAVTELSVN